MIAAQILVGLLAALALFQLALAAGAPLGHFAWGGQHRVLPVAHRIGSLLSIVVYAVMAGIALDRAGLIDVVPDSVSRVGMWVVFAYVTVGIGMNAMSRSKPERRTMVPVSVALSVLCLLVASRR